MPKYEFDARRYCQANMERMGKMPNGQLVGLLFIREIDQRDVEIEGLRAELAALKEAARPVVEWWEAYWRFMDGKGPIPNPVLSVLSKTDICRVSGQQLDALAALVVEEQHG